ncbi:MULTISPECIES: TetR/AcrR family transcriptional regulator [unclassified Stenotrophomonas]|uniref:TetR/AcrR family transcriptional regulator n=1 Tax=unclassified Stenotrophomonas TaxID=196198 RepID=UPI003012E83E
MSPIAATESTDVRDRILSTGQRIMGGKGFSAVGLNEVLSAAGVPKGSFYHYFASKEAFGDALLDDYFAAYLADMDRTFAQPGKNRAQQLEAYFAAWKDNQSFEDCQGKCLAVKLGAEVADLSHSMRTTLQRGTAGIIERLAHVLEAGTAEGSFAFTGKPDAVAQSLYALWLGASLMVKIVRDTQPFDTAWRTTQQILHPAA